MGRARGIAIKIKLGGYMRKTKLLIVMALAAALMTGCGGSQAAKETAKPDYSNIKVNLPDKKPDHITIAKDAVEEFAISEDGVGNCPLVYNSEDGKFHIGTYDGEVLESKDDMAYEGDGNTLTLKGFNYSASFAPVLIFEDETKIILEEGTSNYFAVESETAVADADYTSVIYALDSLSIEGNGIFYATYPETTSGDSCAVRVRGDLNITDTMFYPYSAASAGENTAVSVDGDVNFTSSDSAVIAAESVITTGIKCANLNITDTTLSITAGAASNINGDRKEEEIVSSGIIASGEINSVNSTVSVESADSTGASEAVNAGKGINVTGGLFNGIAGIADRSIGILSGGDFNITNAYSAGRVAQANYNAYGIYAKGDVNVSGDTSDTCITADAGVTFTTDDACSCALYTKGTLNQDGGMLDATAGESTISRGIAADKGLNFKKGSLTAFGYKSLIICDDGVITVSDGTDVFGSDNEFISGETKSLWSTSNNTAFFSKS